MGRQFETTKPIGTDTYSTVRRSHGISEVRFMNLQQATSEYLMELRGRAIGDSSIKKYEHLFEGLRRTCPANLREINAGHLRAYRATWAAKPSTAAKRLGRLRSFFRFSAENGWIAANPAISMRPPRFKATQKLPYTPDEVQGMVGAAETLPLGDAAQFTNHQLVLFIQFLLHSGLRIGDAVGLDPRRVAHGRVHLYTAKTGQPVYIPLPDWLVQALPDACINGRLFGGHSKGLALNQAWRIRLARAAVVGGVQNASPHRFRHTFAVRLLSKGVPVEDVSILLGHSSVNTTQQYYSAWIPERAAALEARVRRIW